MTVAEACNSSEWSWEQDKAFENALATYAEESSIWWEKIAEDVPGKTLEEIKQHYDLLEDDVNRIVSGCVPLPPYNSFDGSARAGDEGAGKRGVRRLGHCDNDSNRGSKSSRSDQERRKGVAWTEDEHRLFLLGLDKYGKGDWRSISRNFVVTRTPTQVASHAQKYFIRLNSMNKDRRRSSIHDITSVGSGDILAQGPITGQSNGATAGVPSGKPAKLPHQHPTLQPGIGMYGTTTMGESIGGPLVSAVGRPVNLASSTHMAYGITVPGAPMNMGHATYPTSHTTAHR